MTGKVIVTGASSFLGSHLAAAFSAAGWEVLATHSLPLHGYDPLRIRRLTLAAEHGRLYQLDIRDAGAMARLVKDERPDLWIHHAGYAAGYASADYPLMHSLDVNAAPLIPLYHALADTNCAVIVTGSSQEYARSEGANREDDACWPDSAYGLSKQAETLLARQLAISHQVPTRVARLYIPFGPLDNPEKLIPSAKVALLRGDGLALSACMQRRDFVAVGDVCRAYVALAADMRRSMFDIFNIASGQAVELRSLLRHMAAILGADGALLQFGARGLRPGEPATSYADIGKAQRLLGWSPTPLATSLAEYLRDEEGARAHLPGIALPPWGLPETQAVADLSGGSGACR